MSPEVGEDDNCDKRLGGGMVGDVMTAIGAIIEGDVQLV